MAVTALTGKPKGAPTEPLPPIDNGCLLGRPLVDRSLYFTLPEAGGGTRLVGLGRDKFPAVFAHVIHMVEGLLVLGLFHVQGGR
jgi:hypothetical protein